MTMEEYRKLKNQDRVWVKHSVFSRPISGVVLQRMTPFGINAFAVHISVGRLKIAYATDSIEEFVANVFTSIPDVIEAEFKECNVS